MAKYSKERMEAVAVVESLRAGVPTRASTRALPDLRAEIIESIKGDLTAFEQGSYPPGRMIWGRYGEGKTHALTAAEHLALDMGFAVSRVSLSREVSCHNLFNFYSRAASSIRTPDSAVLGLQRALNKRKPSELLDTPLSKVSRYPHPLPTYILEDYFYTEGEEQDALYGDLMGNRITVADFRRIHRACRGSDAPRFEPFKPNQHAEAYFGVMADAIRLCGYKGWIILIDELELVGRLGAVSRLKAYRNLNWLLNWSGGMEYPIFTLAAAAQNLQDEIWFSQKANKKGDRTLMPEMAMSRLGPKAKAEMVNFFETAIKDTSISMKPMREDELAAFLERLVLLHGTAYEWEAALDVRELISHIGSAPVRTHIRGALEALDIQYVYHEEYRPQPEALVENILAGEFDDAAEEMDF